MEALVESSVCESVPVLDPVATAESAGLTYVTDEDPGIRRRRAGRGFGYYDRRGQLIRDEKTLARIRALAIPPAYTDVWICPDPNGHIQATGRDVKGRKQYRYHARWTEARDETKYGRLIEFAEALPRIRARLKDDMAKRGLPREKVVATVISLLDSTLIRIGNLEYAKQNQSFGLTTLQDEHVEVSERELRFSFKGKSGKTWDRSLKDRRVAKIVRSCQDLPGQHLFQYLDGDGEQHAIGSSDVNAYIHDVLGPDFTAKHFRTWAGTVTAADALRNAGAFTSKREATIRLNKAIDQVAARLVNTRAVSRRCYIHPAVVSAYLDGTLADELAAAEAAAEAVDGLKPEEVTVLTFLKRRGSEPN